MRQQNYLYYKHAMLACLFLWGLGDSAFDEISAAQQLEFQSWFVIVLNICRRSLFLVHQLSGYTSRQKYAFVQKRSSRFQKNQMTFEFLTLKNHEHSLHQLF